MSNPLGPLIFLSLSFVVQSAGFLSTLLIQEFFPSVEILTSSTLLIHCLVALAGSLFLRFPRSWVLLNSLMPLALFIGSGSPFPGWIPLVILIFLVLIYLPAFWTRVPYYPTSLPMYKVVLDQLPIEGEFTMLDIGCGFGDLLKYLATNRPAAKFQGIEIGPLPYLMSKVRFLVFGAGNIEIKFQSLWKLDLSKFDFVYAFLSPAPMPRLWEKVKAEMRSGTTFMTNSFVVPAPADREIAVEDKHRCVLYLHKIK